MIVMNTPIHMSLMGPSSDGSISAIPLGTGVRVAEGGDWLHTEASFATVGPRSRATARIVGPGFDPNWLGGVRDAQIEVADGGREVDHPWSWTYKHPRFEDLLSRDLFWVAHLDGTHWLRDSTTNKTVRVMAARRVIAEDNQGEYSVLPTPPMPGYAPTGELVAAAWTPLAYMAGFTTNTMFTGHFPNPSPVPHDDFRYLYETRLFACIGALPVALERAGGKWGTSPTAIRWFHGGPTEQRVMEAELQACMAEPVGDEPARPLLEVFTTATQPAGVGLDPYD